MSAIQAIQPQPGYYTTMAPQQDTAGQAPAAGQPAAGKAKGKPDHAGGPNKATALPPGLQGKTLPPGNPWNKVAEAAKAAAQQQPAAAAAKPAQAPATAAKPTAGAQADASTRLAYYA